MKNTLLLSLLLLLSTHFASAQCGANEVEIKVEIKTDNWGYETSWKLTELTGAIILEGGLGGVYDNFSTYTDSVCVAVDGCFFFEIFDSYGDGIYAPYGYELYVDEVLVSSGANDIGSYASVTAYCPTACAYTWDALNELQAHIDGSNPLSIVELNQLYNIFNTLPECLAESEAMILLGKSVIANYDDEIGALFTTPATMNGFSKTLGTNPAIELARAMVALEQGVFDQVFTSANYSAYPQHINQWKFNSCVNFPGYVDPPSDSSLNHSITILADFKDPDGMNPYYDINGDGTAHALRPTGFYLAPGTVSNVTVPAELIGKDFYIRVGSHEWDLTNKPQFKRQDRISKKFAIDATSIEVFNPLGGAISILVPYEATEGIVEINATNIVEAPFISIKSFYETLDIDAELNKPGPWAVFESENVMYTIPKHAIIPGQYDLIQTLQDWETAVRGVNSIMARQIIPDKHNMYMIADVMIRSGAYSIGYPMSNTPLNYFNVPGPAYFIDGPDPDDETNFHETGHALAMSKFPGEEEALVNVPYIMALNHGLNVDLNEAVNYSFVPNTFDIDKTATHRMVSNSFGTERNISNSTMNEVRYQHRGYGHYFEIVNLLGWCPLRNFWKQESIDFENGINHGINDQNIDSRITRMSTAAQADLRPLFHVFGILPQDSLAVQASFDQLNIPPSQAVYNRLQDYLDLIPVDNTAFVNYALSVYPDLYTNGPTDNPDYGVGWHYQKSLTYDAAEAQQRTDILQSIINLYYPNGEPTGNTDPDVCCLLDTMDLSIVNEEIVVTGGVAPYDISIEVTGNVHTVTVVDFDGCASTVQYTIINLSESEIAHLQIFPNPTDGEVQINFGAIHEQVSISLFDQIGRLIQTQSMLATETVSYQLPEPSGIYYLNIRFASGRYSSIMVMKE
jgi:N-terminal domain of M60-like peptidases/Secretion system C-terminal sorting domain/Peptidase M60, enhancin and enhancin-like